MEESDFVNHSALTKKDHHFSFYLCSVQRNE